MNTPNFDKIAEDRNARKVTADAKALRRMYVLGIRNAGKAVREFKCCELERKDIPRYAASMVESWADEIEIEGRRRK